MVHCESAAQAQLESVTEVVHALTHIPTTKKFVVCFGTGREGEKEER